MALKLLPIEKPNQILVRATNWLGDAVMSLPALHALRESFPLAHIAILAKSSIADLYRREPFCDETIVYPSFGGLKGLQVKTALANQLRARRFDLGVLLQNAFEAAAFAWSAGIPFRIGFDRDGRGFLLTSAVAVPDKNEIPEHQRFYYLELLKRSGLIHDYSPDVDCRLSCAATAAEQGHALFKERGILGLVVGVSPGAAYGGAKRWLPERFAEAAASVSKNLSASVVVFGSAGERDIAEQVKQGVANRGVPSVNFAGQTTLRELIDMAAACNIHLTNDSGAMHISSALGVPTVTVFGATDDRATGPTGANSRVVRHPVECSPCLLRECPIDHRCMTRVSADAVTETALNLFQLYASRAV